MSDKFNDFRFYDLDYYEVSTKYFTMNRINEDETKLVVNVADSHLFSTKFGWGLVLDRLHVLYLKEWQVDRNFFGNEVLLNKAFFKPRQGWEQEGFGDNPDALTWEYWLGVAKVQEGHEVRWRK